MAPILLTPDGTLRRQRLLLITTAIASATLWAYACGDGTTEPPPDPPRPTTVTVSPATAELAALGATVQLRAQVLDQNGQVMAGATVTWASSATAVATVNASGLVTAAANGAATITATAGDASGTSEINVFDSDRTALVALYNATDGPNWIDNTNWLTDARLGEWYGVTADSSGRVVQLDLRGQWDDEARAIVLHGLRGELPDELANLTQLTSLSLSDNDLNGPIPPELGQLVNLQSLFLGRNGLSGPIPPELGNLSELSDLRLYSNNLSGEIPPELGSLSNLSFVDLSRNGLSGVVPPELGSLANLRSLFLSGNALSGPIPPELGDLANVVFLDLCQNDLSGAIPPVLGSLANLRSLCLFSNDLSGAIPPELGDLRKLRFLDLGSNDLSGAIPPELVGLGILERLGLSDNDLSGAIPPELGNLANLDWLDLGRNALSGAIPPELGNLGKLTRLDLSYNDLSGAIPQSFLQLDRLQRLFVGGQEVCVPGASAFVTWFDRIGHRDAKAEVVCNVADVAALESLYDLTGGANWTESSGWSGGNPVEDWYGVTADSLGHVTELDLEGNRLAGRLPGALGNLPRMTVLRIADNALHDRLPLSLTALDLEEFHYDDTDLCEPADAGFRDWLDGIPSHRGTAVQCPPLTERDALVALYANTGGSGWTNRNGWLTEAPLSRWSGVEVDAQGRVVRLDLSGNALSGMIPPELSGLSNLGWLELWGNNLSGVIPPELGDLANLFYLDLRLNELSSAIPPELGGLSNLQHLFLSGNALSGAIPPELGGLSKLAGLLLGGNELSGAIPPELGNLSNLWILSLSRNELAGAIPPELGDLSHLSVLRLDVNELSGAIPPELGDLANLEWLDLGQNDLSGPIPPELGGLGNLKRMRLGQNALSGTVPPTFGALASLIDLELSHNAGLAGAMPAGLRHLALESLIASGTELCVPREPEFEEWLATIPRRRIAVCGEPPAAYLVQAVQSRAHPVPLVAGEDALLRVFVTAAMETTEGIPGVRARFYLNGSERHVADIAANSTPIPTKIDEGDLSKSANAEIPGRIVQPGLEMVVEIDPDGMLDESLGVPGRIPREGRLAVEVREMPVLDLTVIPFLWSSDPDSAITGLVEGMEADPEDHPLLEDTHVLLPVGDVDVTARAPVASTSNDAFDLLAQTEAIRVLEGGVGHYKGMMSGVVTGAGGVAYLGGRSSFSRPSSYIIAHELGHNMSLSHAPCGGAAGPDPSFPYANGAIGAWGYDISRNRLVPTTRKDHMSYCGPTWTSDYHFTNALGHRLADEGASAEALASATTTSLLLWGGVDTTGTPFLNPAFVANASPTLPDSAGDYTVTGRDGSGRELFSLSFTMPVALSEEAEMSSFVFALPVQPGWADALASVTLSGPADTATLDGDSDIPMAILRDPVTGRVRGFLRDMVDPVAVQADALVSAGVVNVLFSRGIPDAAAWQR